MKRVLCLLMLFSIIPFMLGWITVIYLLTHPHGIFNNFSARKEIL